MSRNVTGYGPSIGAAFEGDSMQTFSVLANVNI
jgi:hypothetical protein